MSAFELSLLALTLLIGTSIICSTVIVGISPMPSSKKARNAMMQLLATVTLQADTGSETGAETGAQQGAIVDVGSGWGSLIIRLAIKYPSRQIIGYELSLVPWFVTVLISKLLRLNNLTVYRQDFLKADLSAASIVVCYLFPAGMAALAAKLADEKTAIEYVISNNFALPSLPAEKTIRLDDFYQSPVYRYRLVGERDSE